MFTCKSHGWFSFLGPCPTCYPQSTTTAGTSVPTVEEVTIVNSHELRRVKKVISDLLEKGLITSKYHETVLMSFISKT